MTKNALYATAALLGLAIPSTAAAQGTAQPPDSCPPGSWFCAQPGAPSAPGTGTAAQPLAPLPNPDAPAQPPPAPLAATPSPAPPANESRPPPPVGPPLGPPPGAPPPPDAPPPPYAYPYLPRYYPDAPPPPLELPSHEWGLNLHMAGATIGRGMARNTGMWGGGVGLRFRPVRHFALEADADMFEGTDYQANSRSEAAFSLAGLFFINPRSRAQVYLLGGIGLSTAHVTCDPSAPCGGPLDAHYGYFGGEAGAGFELRLSRVVALDADLRGFVRTRIDAQSQSQPEFVDAFGRKTNASGGGLLTAGIVFYL